MSCNAARVLGGSALPWFFCFVPCCRRFASLYGQQHGIVKGKGSVRRRPSAASDWQLFERPEEPEEPEEVVEMAARRWSSAENRRFFLACRGVSAGWLAAVLLPLTFAWAGVVPAAAAGPRTAAADYGIPEVRLINQAMRAGWQDARLVPSPQATDGEWCRRVYLDLVGRIPTIKELESFTKDSTDDKKLRLVDQLLGDAYLDEYARSWADVWTTILIGRDADNDLVSRPGMRQYLRRSLSKNMPYDQFVRELVTASGSNTPGSSNFNGATNFLSGKMADNGIQAAARTAQVFLAMQVQCTQCHNHPFNKGKQNQFWEFNAFFRQAAALRRFDGGNDVASVELVDQDFAGEGGDPDEAEIYYELRNGLTKVAYPVFLDGAEISKSGYLPGTMSDGTAYGVNRRQELAEMMVASPLLSRAVVNRLWGHFFGYGFTKPVDDLGDHNAPTHPELLNALAESLMKASYDTKELMRWVVLSEAYGLSSRTSRGNRADDPSMGEQPMFSHFYLRQMTAEQLYESLLTATRADLTGDAEEQARMKDEWLGQFVIAFGTDDGADTTTFNGSIPQVLMMFNGPLIKAATETGNGGFLDAVAASGMSNAQKIDMLYQAALARQPTRREVVVANALIGAREGDVTAALQDVWWAVLNSNEFIINH